MLLIVAGIFRILVVGLKVILSKGSFAGRPAANGDLWGGAIYELGGGRVSFL